MGNEKYDPKVVAESFRSSIKDLLTIAEKLTPFCERTADMVQMLELAIENDGQLNFLMFTVLPKK